MAKLNDNLYLDTIKKKIIDNDFPTKEELLEFLNKNRKNILQNSEIQQYFQDSFIKLNDETLNEMNKILLEFYDKRKANDLTGLDLENVSELTIDDGQGDIKNYIKVEKDDGSTMIIDNSLDDRHFVEQFNEKQNELVSAQTSNKKENTEAILSDMESRKEVANLTSASTISRRELTPEERREFAAVMHINEADTINFLVDVERNLYVNKDTGDVYFPKKNSEGKLEVHKANEVSAEKKVEEINTINDSGMETTSEISTYNEPNFDELSDSDLEYIVENNYHNLTETQIVRIKEIMAKRKEENQNKIDQPQLNKDKTYVKKILNTQFNGFVSLVFLCSIVGFMGVTFLILILNKI